VLPETFWCYAPHSNEPAPGQLPSIQNGYITFGCLNHFRKINPDVLELWAQVLRTLETSRLVMLAPDGQARTRTLDIFKSQGIDSSRLGFVPRLNRADYLSAYAGIDICLDSFPYGGHTTSLDAFWMGVPVISLLGPTVVGRACWSIATNLGLAHLVARTPEEYVAKAQELAANGEELRTLRQGLRERMEKSPLMNYQKFARNMERAYRKAWAIWCEGGSADRSPIQIEDA
jgi:predicted O-linked N-acetylglucosamine transferase (SPINDLY family)